MPETQSRFGKHRMREVDRLGPFFPDTRELGSSLPTPYSLPGSPLAAQTELSNDLLGVICFETEPNFQVQAALHFSVYSRLE